MSPSLPMTAALARFPGSERVDLAKLATAEIEFERKYAELREWVRARGEVK